MQVYGPAHLHGPQALGAPHSARMSPPVERTAETAIHDELQISEAARLAEQTQGVPEVRQERIDAIRAQIASGTYETPEKLDVALERLLDEIG